MKVPFRLQASEYDCVPTALINALSRLFERKEIPPSLIQRIYLYSLDREVLCGEVVRGTSDHAIEILSIMLNKYRDDRHRRFAVSTEFIKGHEVHLDQESKILHCIDSGGVALLRVWLDQHDWHYILAFAHKDGNMHCFDSYRPSKEAGIKNSVIFADKAVQQEHNLSISFTRLNTDINEKTVFERKKHKYTFGANDKRECLLVSRH